MPKVKSNALLLRARELAQEMNRQEKRSIDGDDPCPSEPDGEFLGLEYEIMKTLIHVPDSRYRLLLQARYLDAQTWPDIAKLLRCSSLQAQRLHKVALLVFEEALAKARGEQ